MLNTVALEQIFVYVILVAVYLFSTSFAGFFKALTAKLLGDDSAEKLGFLTLNPLAHLDPIGFIILLYNKTFGWGKEIPLNPYNFHYKWRALITFCVSISPAIGSFLLTLLSLIIFIYQFIGATACSPDFGIHYFLKHLLPLQKFSLIFPHYSSLKLVLGMFLVHMIIFNAILGALTIIIQTIKHALMLIAESRNEDYSAFTEMIVVIAACIFFSNRLVLQTLHILVSLARYLTLILGL